MEHHTLSGRRWEYDTLSAHWEYVSAACWEYDALSVRARLCADYQACLRLRASYSQGPHCQLSHCPLRVWYSQRRPLRVWYSSQRALILSAHTKSGAESMIVSVCIEGFILSPCLESINSLSTSWELKPLCAHWELIIVGTNFKDQQRGLQNQNQLAIVTTQTNIMKIANLWLSSIAP